MDKYAIIVAGGAGARMGSNVPKQFLLLRNKPVLWYSLTAFLDAFTDLEIILVLPEQYLERGEAIAKDTAFPGRIKIAGGGETRFHSVKNGLQLVNTNSTVFIHDGVRCLVTPDLIRRCYTAAIAEGNAIPAIVAVDTLRIETLSGYQQIDRNKVKIVQTPQTFTSEVLKKAFMQDYHPDFTDDASVVEKLGERIHLVEGEATNIKITRQVDLLIAEQILGERSR